jgi:hypothetical protein
MKRGRALTPLLCPHQQISFPSCFEGSARGSAKAVPIDFLLSDRVRRLSYYQMEAAEYLKIQAETMYV